MKGFFKFLPAAACFLALAAQNSPAQVADFKGADNVLFECKLDGFSQADYAKAVSAIFLDFENEALCRIKPKKYGKVGLKIYSNSGAGLATPKNLTLAVIAELEKRGFKRENICIVDMSRRKMREAGYLPKYSDLLSENSRDDFFGSPVCDIESGKFFDKNWFYDTPLTPRDMKFGQIRDAEYLGEARKSYLPIPLFLTVDFWINLPVITDMRGIGICAALGNATIWNMSNNERFFASPANAPIALAEVAAIPELKESCLMAILSYEKAQFVGGGVFNAAFVSSEKTLYASSNPVILDYYALDYINCKRVMGGFKPISPAPPIFEYARQMNLGTCDTSKIKFKAVKNAD
ncbi:MAG: DUF362 domain-containing protein [Opitutales bacterium]|nr:DUF362 domain-containing protein [Opitutales bacterium]